MASTANDSTIARPSGQIILLATVVAASCAGAGYLFTNYGPASAAPPAAIPAAQRNALTLADIPFDGEQAYEYLQEICEIGTRVSASRGMLAQQKLLADYFEKLGAKVIYQRFRVRHPVDGSPVSMANLIVQWHPQRKERILLCTHYDTRPFPDRDRATRGARFWAPTTEPAERRY